MKPNATHEPRAALLRVGSMRLFGSVPVPGVSGKRFLTPFLLRLERQLPGGNGSGMCLPAYPFRLKPNRGHTEPRRRGARPALLPRQPGVPADWAIVRTARPPLQYPDRPADSTSPPIA